MNNPQCATQRLHQLSDLERRTIEHVEAVIETTRRACVTCVVDNNTNRRTIGLTKSRLGGQYAWPRNSQPPLPGAAAFCLIQVNLAELPEESRETLFSALPRKGLFQVFIQADSHYGCNMQDHQGDGFRIVLHTQLDDMELSEPLSLADTDNLPIGTGVEAMLSTGVPITFQHVSSTAITTNDYRFSGPTVSVLYDVKNRMICSEAFEQWNDEQTAKLDGQEVAVAWLGGHPRFCQEDIRFRLQQNEPYEALVSFASDGHLFSWGDMGDATFLLPETTWLTNLGCALYSWDCY